MFTLSRQLSSERLANLSKIKCHVKFVPLISTITLYPSFGYFMLTRQTKGCEFVVLSLLRIGSPYTKFLITKRGVEGNYGISSLQTQINSSFSFSLQVLSEAQDFSNYFPYIF
uniref:Uncharacterized protein n=1 Tax=Glossina austeni TaxID=7395 RepID=A0A1A9VRI9_GLOAU